LTIAHLLTFDGDMFGAMAICLGTAFALGLLIGLEEVIAFNALSITLNTNEPRTWLIITLP